jgi:hypothetical protein
LIQQKLSVASSYNSINTLAQDTYEYNEGSIIQCTTIQPPGIQTAVASSHNSINTLAQDTFKYNEGSIIQCTIIQLPIYTWNTDWFKCTWEMIWYPVYLDLWGITLPLSTRTPAGLFN